MLEAKHHHPGCRPPSPTGPGQRPSVEEALGSEPRTVSRRYLSSLKNKLSSGAWRKSYQPGTQPGTQPGMGMQVPKGWSKSGELGWGWNVQETHLSSWMPGWMETAGLRWDAGMLGPWLSLRIVSGLLLSMWLLHEVSSPGQPNLQMRWVKAPKRAQAEASRPLRA